MKNLCNITFILSIAIFFASIIFGRIAYVRNLNSRKNFSTRRSYVLTPFQLFLIGFFISATILFFPIYYCDYFNNELGAAKLIKSVLLSIHNTMRLFILDGDFEIIKSSINSSVLGVGLEKAYSIYAAIIFVMAPVLTAGFVLSFFKNVASFLKYFFKWRSDIYVMSELNERSIALTEDILVNNKNNRRSIVLFADVFEKEEEECFELVEQAKRLGAICFRKDITEIGLKPSWFGIKRKFYFVGDDEDENVKQALIMISRCRNKKRYNTPNTQFYVLSNSIESEALLNSTDNGNMKVRRVRQARSLALDILRNHSIFNTKLVKDGKKLISIVIIGLGNYGVELLKTICWCGQMDGYILQLHIFDKDVNLEVKIKSFAPELISFNHKQIEGEPYYDIYFHDNINVEDSAFLSKLSSIKEISTVYVALGDDELNIETAMRMRMQFGRDEIDFKRIMPEIYAIVYSSIKNATFKQNGGLKSIKDIDYGIHFIGSMKKRYALSFIEQEELETEGLKYHLLWAKTEDEIEKNKALYEKYEYYRRSSISKALHVFHREHLGLLNDISDIEDKLLEHKRWNAYMRAEGYVYSIVKDDIAKTHPDLIPFDKLTEREQSKDRVVSS